MGAKAVRQRPARWGIVTAVLVASLFGGSIPASALGASIVVDGNDSASDADGCGGGPGAAADPCNTIQGGVDVSALGDTVNVAAGTYNEGAVTNKQVRLEGAQAGVDARDRASNGESVVVSSTARAPAFDVAANDVSIDGFTLGATQYGYGVRLGKDVSGPTLFNNIFLSSEGHGGVLVEGADAIDIWQNDFRAGWTGIRAIDDGPLDSQVVGATIEDNAFERQSYAAIDFLNVSDLDIIGNTVEGTIRVKVGKTVAIGGNTVTNGEESGIEIGGTDDSLIISNTLMRNRKQGIEFGDAGIYPPSTNALVIGNTITENFGGVVLNNYFQSPVFVGTLEVHLNRIVGNPPYAAWIVNPDVGQHSIGAEDNWWGCNEGPDTTKCDPTKGEIYTDPRLALTLSASTPTLVPSATATLTADLTVDSDGVRVPADLIPLIPPAPVSFAVTGGSLSPAQTLLSNGVATSTFSAPSDERVVGASAALDSGSASTSITVRRPPAVTALERTSPDRTSPFLSQASLVPSSFAVNPRGRAENPISARGKRGTTFSYTVSEEANVTFTIERQVAGRKVGRKCRRQTRKNRGKRRCALYRAVGRFAAQSKAGSNSKPFSGKIGRKSLAVGRYHATLVATDAAGNRSSPKRLVFRVVRR